MNIRRRLIVLPLKEKKQIFYSCFLLLCAILWFIVGYLNAFLDDIFSNYLIIISNVNIDKVSVIIAPIVEESIILFGYGLVFLVDFNRLFNLEYKSKKEFIDNNLVFLFLISVGTFGILEGIVHNRDYCFYCVLAFVFLNLLIHLTFSVYPFVFGRKFGNCFVCFLPIAVLLHSLHNFIITVVWDNKFVTISMVTVFLFPLLFFKRNVFFSWVNKKNVRVILILFFLLIYFYMLVCCLLIF